MPLILELEQAYAQAKADPAFQKEMRRPSCKLMSAGRRRFISRGG